jgi:hypothetical protein
MGMDQSTIVFGKEIAVMVFGPKAQDILTAQFAGKTKGFKNSKTGARALKNTAKNSLFFGFLSPLKVAQKARMGGMNPFATTLAGIKSTSGIALSVGHENGVLISVLDIPTQLLVEAFGVIERVKGSF